MFDVTTFLMRWLYLCNLVRDRAEIQSLPYTPIIQQQHQQQFQQPHVHHQLPPHPPPPLSASPFETAEASGTFQQHIHTHGPYYKDEEEEWRDECLRGILSYPPGTQRLLAMDALRIELIQKLTQQLSKSDRTLQRFAALCQRRKRRLLESQGQEDTDDDDPYLETDVEIVRLFGEATKMEEGTMNDLDEHHSEEEAALVISENGTKIAPPSHNAPTSLGSGSKVPLLERDQLEDPPEVIAREAIDSHRVVLQLREYLPQIVSAVLHSPPALTQVQGLDPIHKLRRLILTRCLQDASFGIDLCWLLEAEVGRAWKTLFEHRQQTGKRLIVVLPAERAVALAKIGMEKQGAFHLLQDAEQATAYGYLLPDMDHPSGGGMQDTEPSPPRLPSSLSMRRCSHFGDTMHFIDRLTQISLDLRLVPSLQRESHLAEALTEMNRRLRRRMITSGDVSLDVEDNRGPFDWPEVSDLNVDMLKYSVHLPLEPLCGFQADDDDPRGEGSDADLNYRGVMRVLNIVVPECRILASRERCPYLIQLELVETGLDGSDARLYAGGSRDIGTTIEEALGLVSDASASDASARRYSGFPGCQIPSELMATPIPEQSHTNIVPPVSPESTLDRDCEAENDGDDDPDAMGQNMIRGGWQADDEAFYNSGGSDYMYTSPYDTMRQREYEQLHQQMSFQPPRPATSSSWQQTTTQRPPLTMKSALLDRIFGLPWAEKCKQVRQTSPFGNVTGWRLATFIMKAGEDIRREALVMQVITKMNEWFKSEIPEPHRPYLRPYRIMCVGGDAGLLECVNDAKSVDEVKKRTDSFLSLRDYFERAYGPPKRNPRRAHPTIPNETPQQNPLPSMSSSSEVGPTDDTIVSFETAQENFLRSLVGYSLVSYVFQIKDRHNANILLDREGHLMHIDFGFVLGDTPKMCKVPIFSERAPFKMSTEFWEVIGGWNFNEGGLGVRFCKMFEIAFACAASHVDEIASSVEAAILNLTRDPEEARSIANGVRSRLTMRGPANSVEQKNFVMELVNTALTGWGRSTYDWLQKSMNGYQ